LLKREIFIQRKLKHQNILQMKDCFEDENNIYLVLEYAECGSLFEYIQKKDTLGEREAFIFFIQSCLAVEFLHKNDIVHRDIKPENLLLDARKNLKLCDFGCSFKFIQKGLKIRKTFCGTLDYMAPEFFTDKTHGLGVDIWALGVLLYEMLHGGAPFEKKDEKEKLGCIKALISGPEANVIPMKESLSEDVKNLILSLMKTDPVNRFRFDDVFDSRWVKKYAQR
jgi:serine/threonine protein kinase